MQLDCVSPRVLNPRRRGASGPASVALRIAVLAAAWRLRCRRAAWDSQFTPTDVVKAAIADLRTIARADWVRATSPGGLRLDGVSPRVLNRCRGAAGRATIADFELKWCGGGFLLVPQRLARAPRLPYAGCASPHTITSTSRFTRIGLA
jgi:hypothetical protein